MSRRLACGLFFVFAAGCAHAQALGACAWSRADPAAKAFFLSTYRQSPGSGEAALRRMDHELREAFAGCAYRTDVPALWVEKDLTAEAIKDGAAEVLADKGVLRPELTQAWSEAPEAARNCIMANAARVFGVPAPACRTPAASGWFLTRFRAAAGDGAMATQLLYYFNASAQSEWAEALIREFETRVPPAPALAPDPSKTTPSRPPGGA